MSTATPRVSIGLPVFNGENYLREAVDSILAQTYDDFELIISDNASTDATAAICQDYAARDARVIYHRNAHNLGAAANYDQCFHLARGEFFKWAAHDDMLREDFLAQTVARLDADPAAVLCVFATRHVNAAGETIEYTDLSLRGLASEDPAERLAAVLAPNTFHYFFGLFRRQALVGSQLHGDFMGSDVVLLAEAALRGRFAKCARPLFIHRRHAQSYSRSVWRSRAAAMHWFDPGRSARRGDRRLTFLLRLAGVTWRNTRSLAEWRRCLAVVRDYARTPFMQRTLRRDIAWRISPRLYRRLYGDGR